MLAKSDYSQMPSSECIVKRVEENMVNGKKTQSVFLPNGIDEIRMALILASHLKTSGKEVMIFRSFGINKYSIMKALGTEYDSSMLDGIILVDNDNAKALARNKCDVVITINIGSLFDSGTLKDFQEKVRNFDTESFEKRTTMPSVGQASLYAIHFLFQLIERENVSVISFEHSSLNDIGFTPIISSHHALVQEEIQSEVRESCADEYRALLDMKKELVVRDNYNYSQVNSINQNIDFILNMLTTRYNRLQMEISHFENDVEVITNEIKKMNSIVGNKKEEMDLCFSDEINHQDVERRLNMLTNSLTESLTSCMFELSKQVKYKQIQELVSIRLGKEWEKLTDDSKKYLITAKFTFDENMSLGESVDYSSVCLLAAKALEVELAKRFVTRYESFLIRKEILEEQWPSGIILFNKMTGKKKRMKEEDFTLGTSPYIMGLSGRKIEKEYNSKLFLEYCKSDLMPREEEKSIRLRIKKISKQIGHIKDKYRNPAAHKKPITIITASECLDYVLEVEHVLKSILEQFAY